ncbi:MAG: NAD(P)-binding domain-containing protein [Planctomycetota bacterium]
MAQWVEERDHAVAIGADKAQLQYPDIDLSRCLGCGTCVDVCPEDGVLELVHGQAVVVNGGRCQGIAACERECPVGAITMTLGDLTERKDIPALDGLEAIGSSGLFLAGEVTAHALIKVAIEHGAKVATEVARRVEDGPEEPNPRVLDLCVVGAGPAGLACSLEAKRRGLRFVTLEQEEGVGGTVAKYPRRKLVMTEPVDLPLYGRMKRSAFSKEELMELWQSIAAEHELPIENRQVFTGVQRDAAGHFVVSTETHRFVARHVCLALGRRGVPTKLNVPGEDLSKVAYSLMDAHSYQGRRILVVGGGDSAVEAAMGLAEQPGNAVHLSYRRGDFFRIRSKNQRRLEACLADGSIVAVMNSAVVAIHPRAVDLRVQRGDASKTVRLRNDDVFVMAGGIPPFELLRSSGVSFDSSLREPAAPIEEQGTGLGKALAAGFVLALGVLAFASYHADYYGLSLAQRPAHEKHGWLSPGVGLGFWFGVLAALLVVVNLVYLLRRASWCRLGFGSLQAWMTSHVATGILALLFAMLHGAMAPRDTPGGNAFWALVVLLVTGAIGRYFYAYVPRAANGRELELAEVKEQLRFVADDWGHGERAYRERVRAEVSMLIEHRQWRGSFLGRVAAMIGGQRELARCLGRLTKEGREQRLPENEIREGRELARRAHRVAMMAAHYEDLRALLGTWRYLHRWVAALMVVLVVLHVIYALSYGVFLFERGVG